uniref:Uncharacterized protein n=1 Tax=Anguilla anguilla TaxID=7936 RepID=A0A0E9Q023_ANGAN
MHYINYRLTKTLSKARPYTWFYSSNKESNRRYFKNCSFPPFCPVKTFFKMCHL